ncbi:N-acetylmuramoyl-L-alanine amidase family protein [Propionispora hippei]|uniref:N-acetylmuramoyl-L-alanine amidase n=1 Tax=Propionispora hippei DSM 15287 TaxID=1123003 RepID=A0A1M6D8H3_9FIRM|nr:N-acetylmuramoyl-L-alanine amidase [Propionispora hippei]SHI69450.1 N-acetylmuramoyl-L-alanine amidase [Propionispora hippei DSM 15287]
MYNTKLLAWGMLFLMVCTFLLPLSAAHAASADSVLGTLASSTVASKDSGSGGSGFFEQVFGFLFDKVLGPIFNIFGGGKSSSGTSSPVNVIPLPSSPGDTAGGVGNTASLRGKVIVVDPGHGGSNPGAVANNDRESDNNLAVGLKLRDKLVQAGAKVIMTRDTDRTVAPEGSSLGEELEARVAMAEQQKADIFVSIHSNSNPDSNIAGAMTFYHSNKSPDLARAVQTALIKTTGAVDKGISPATFYVLRNTTMPGVLVEMGFVTNEQESVQLKNDAYRGKVAQGVFNGIAAYFANR